MDSVDEEIRHFIHNLVIVICKNFNAADWLKSALMNVPYYILTQSEKEKFVLSCDDSYELY